MNDRCITDEQKEEFLSRLLVAWKKVPSLRFGQLLSNVLFSGDGTLYYTEDLPFLDQIETWVDDAELL